MSRQSQIDDLMAQDEAGLATVGHVTHRSGPVAPVVEPSPPAEPETEPTE